MARIAFSRSSPVGPRRAPAARGARVGGRTGTGRTLPSRVDICRHPVERLDSCSDVHVDIFDSVLIASGQASSRSDPEERRNDHVTRRARRRPDRRRRPVRHRRGLPPAPRVPRQDRSRSSSRATPSAARGTCSATPASARTPTCSPSATRSSRGRTAKSIADGAVDPRTTSARRRASTASTARSATATGWCAPSGRRETARWTVTSTVGGTDETATMHLLVPRRSARATTATTRASPRRSPAATTSPARIVHPQHWPEDLDYAGKRVVVIGSGATAVTLVPAMADGDGAAEHVTMLQRSPTYISAVPVAGHARRPAAPAAARSRPAYDVDPLEERAARRRHLPAQPAPSGAGEGACCARRRPRSCRPGSTSTRT